MSFQGARCALPSMYGVLGVKEVLFQAGKDDKPQVKCLECTLDNPHHHQNDCLFHPRNIFAIPKKNKPWKLFLLGPFVPEPPASPLDDCRNDSAARLDAVSTLSLLANSPSHSSQTSNRAEREPGLSPQPLSLIGALHKTNWTLDTRRKLLMAFFPPHWSLVKMFDSCMDGNKMELLSHS